MNQHSSGGKQGLFWGFRKVIRNRLITWSAAVLAVGMAGYSLVPKVAVVAASSEYAVKPISLPDSNGLVTLDYFAFDHTTKRLWVPGGNTGNVDVIDSRTGEIKKVSPFATAEINIRGKQRTLGPSSISLGDGVVYIGNRADASICVIDTITLKSGECTRVATPSEGLAAAPDGLIYVSATKELWFTRGAPPLGINSPDQSIFIMNASDPYHLKSAGKVAIGGSAEGYAADDKRGIFYTNLEGSGQTIAIDVRRRVILSKWKSGCDDPRGLALDRGRRFLFVACPDRVLALDTVHDGRVLDTIVTGQGLDNIDFLETWHTLYAAASDAATLTIATVDDHGKFDLVATVPTVKGARGVVAGEDGRAYLIDPIGGRILEIAPKK